MAFEKQATFIFHGIFGLFHYFICIMVFFNLLIWPRKHQRHTKIDVTSRYEYVR